MSPRTLQRVIEAIPTSDGAGVKLRRSLGQSAWARLDPFLMLDHFSTDNAEDYIAGFPAHPHRGFETVTYMLDGHMRHEDHLGNVGELKSGGVQWMTAGRGISTEMPQQDAYRMRGFQLWINHRRRKMKPAGYRDIQSQKYRSSASRRRPGESDRRNAGRQRAITPGPSGSRLTRTRHRAPCGRR
jgi:redox-sensitive bicupin YhaK (pirin superfamily)